MTRTGIALPLVVALLFPTIVSAVEVAADAKQPWVYPERYERYRRSTADALQHARFKGESEKVIEGISKTLPLMWSAALTDTTVGIVLFAELSDGDGDIPLPSDCFEFTLVDPDDEKHVVRQRSLWVLMPTDYWFHTFWDTRRDKLSLNDTRDPQGVAKFGAIRLLAVVPNEYVGWVVERTRMVHDDEALARPASGARTVLPPAGLSAR